MKLCKLLTAITLFNTLLMTKAFLYNGTIRYTEPTPYETDNSSHHFTFNKVSQSPLFGHGEEIFSSNPSSDATLSNEVQPAYQEEYAVSPSSLVDLVTDEAEEPTQFNELLDFIEMNMAGYGEDLLANCVDEADVQNMIQEVTKDYKTSLRKLFILEFILFGIAFSLCVVTLGVVCRKNVKKRHLSRAAFNVKKKSFINDYETSEMYTDATDPSFEQNSTAHHSAEGNNHNHAYSVHV